MALLDNISKAFYINLDRRQDRRDHINSSLPFPAERFSAIDAHKVELNKEVKKLFPRTYSSRSKAEICCAISHYRLWQKLTMDKYSSNYLILEDDVVFKPGFVNFWNQEFSSHIPKDYNLIYLGGCQPWNKPHYHKALIRRNDYFYNVKKNDYFTKGDNFWHMNASSYILNKNAASLLCQWVDQNGMDDALDNFMQNFFNGNKLFSIPQTIYHLNPLMAYQLHEENDNTEIDKNSDIRNSKERFGASSKKISVIIPTVWAAKNYTHESLRLLDSVGCIDEVIVIDNNTKETPEWINNFNKVKLIKSKKTMYFNASINTGMDICKNEICCIYNDDIISDTRIFNYIKDNINKEDGCIFISPEYINTKKTHQGFLKKANDIIKGGLHHGGGMLMFLNKSDFIKIPDKLVHHFGDTFIFNINKKQDKQNYLVEGFPISTPGSASQTESVNKVIEKDWEVHKEIFNDLDSFLPNKFPFLNISPGSTIPKKIHLSWKNKNILNSNYLLIKKGAKNLELLNPGWDIEVNDDEDVNRYIRDSVGKSSWKLIKDKKITEKTDLWRLLKVHKEGGLYIDIDRYIDTPLSEIVNEKTSCVIPTFNDTDFSQDFILSCANNPMIERAISNNLFNRKNGQNLFYTAVCSYMHAVSEFLSGKQVDRGDNPDYFNDIRKQIHACECLETYRELGPENHILFRDINKQFNLKTFEKDKADFYNGENVIHWNSETQALHNSQKSKKQKLIFTQNNLFEHDFICELFENFDVVIDKEMAITEEDSIVVYSDMYANNLNLYPKKHRENLNQLREKQIQYFEKLKDKNCILVHLSDEHCHARIDHYKNFKHVFRQYYRSDAVAGNVTFIPLGYSKGFSL